MNPTEQSTRPEAEGRRSYSQSAGEAPAGKRRAAIIGGVVVAILLIGFLAWHLAHRGQESTDDAFVDAHIIPIAAKVAGQVSAVYINDNQVVKAGDALFDIDPRDYQAKVAEQRAKVAAADAEARRAASDAKRYRQIFEADEISRQQLDNAEATATTAQANAARERAALQQDELNVSYTHVTAPESGRITRKSVEPGGYIQVGQTLLSIVPDQVWVTANFKETQLTHMRPGQKVRIKVDAFPGRRFDGHVDSIQSGTGERFSVMPPENATGNFVKVVQRIPVKIAIDTPADPNVRLAPGMSVVPTIYVE